MKYILRKEKRYFPVWTHKTRGYLVDTEGELAEVTSVYTRDDELHPV